MIQPGAEDLVGQFEGVGQVLVGVGFDLVRGSGQAGIAEIVAVERQGQPAVDQAAIQFQMKLESPGGLPGQGRRGRAPAVDRKDRCPPWAVVRAASFRSTGTR